MSTGQNDHRADSHRSLACSENVGEKVEGSGKEKTAYFREIVENGWGEPEGNPSFLKWPVVS